MKRMIALLLLAALLLSALPVLADTPALTRYTLGSKMDDFTVTTFDGRSVTLSEVLKQKDMVLINIWASWCGPCGMEFPHMQQAYQAYGDRVEIIAVSTEPADTDDVLRDYAQQKGLTFPVARDTANLGLRFAASSIPMSIVVDRFGVVSCIISGAQTSADAFTRLFDAYVGEDYPETVLLNSIPGKRPDVPAAAPERLMEALGVPGDPISFDTPAGVYVWPMIPAEEDGRLCVMPTNGGVNESRSALKCLVQAESGDALAITMKTSTEAAIDLVTITVDGKMVKAFGGEKDWFTYSWMFTEPGAHEVVIAYEKDGSGNEGRDVAFIDTIEVIPAENAAEALDRNPAYPAAAETTLTVLNEGARQVVMDDPTFALTQVFGLADYYVVPGNELHLQATLSREVDPEQALLVNYYDSSTIAVSTLLKDGAYRFTTPLDSLSTTNFPYTNVHLYPAKRCLIRDMRVVVCFAGETELNTFVRMMPQYGIDVRGWSYKEEEPAAAAAAPVGLADYAITFIDQHGEPVEGVIANICDENTCMPMTSDAYGQVTFQNAPYAYDVHVIRVPEGYELDMTQAWKTPAAGGDLVIGVTRK